MKVISVNVGLPAEVAWKGRMVRTSIIKLPVTGPVTVRRLNLDGDAQSDLAAHGGEHRAVFVYQIASYDYWRQFLGRDDWQHGYFGENLTVEGLADAEVCIGDRYQIGTAIFEVTQPRVTCYRLGIRLGVPEMPALVVSHKRPGFYFRVIQEGKVAAGDPILKLSSGPEGMTVAEVDQLLYSNNHPKDELTKALNIPALSKGWQSSFNELLKAAEAGITTGNSGLNGAQGIPLAWTGFRRFLVKKIVVESKEVRSFELTPEKPEPLPPFQPGQHLAIKIPAEPIKPAGSAEPAQSPLFPLIRMYSLCGPPGAPTYRIAVKREGQGSNWLHDHCREGDILEISAPRGAFTLLPGDHPVVLLAAGVGVTPLLAMLYALKKATTREVWWLYGTQNGEHYSFSREITQLASGWKSLRHFNIYSRPSAIETQGVDFDFRGRLSLDILAQLKIPIHADFYLCGPAAYLIATIAALKTLGVPPEQIHYETFGAQTSALSNGKAPHLPAENNGDGPLLTFTKSNISFPWNKKFGSILEAAEAGDIPVHWSCRTGVCHLCESALLDGKVEYSPDPLDPPAEGNILLCCSRPSSPVTLDL